jgi:hypothetical protein
LILFKEWIKDALTELSFQKRERRIRSSSNSLSTVPGLSPDRLVVECTPAPLHPTMNRQDKNIEVTDFWLGHLFALSCSLSWVQTNEGTPMGYVLYIGRRTIADD